MLNDVLTEALGDILAERFTEVNTHYLELLGKQIKDIGTLSPSNLHQLQQMMRTGANVEIIQQELARVTGQTAEDMAKLMETAAASAYEDTSPFYEARNISQLPLEQNVILRNTITAIEKVTLGEMVNLSQTTVIREVYSEAIDKAVWAVQTGQVDYHKAIRSALRETAKTGLRVEYESGYTRRLDSAVRQNVLDGTRAINDGIRRQAGQQFGSDGIEISAHGMCAADHQNDQGTRMSNEAFDKLQNSLRRKFGQWNCGHRVFPIILGISSPAYTRKELADMRTANQKGVTWGDKHYTLYEASQQQRILETSIRYAEDIITLGTAAGDTALVLDTTAKLKELNKTYREFSKAAGLQTRRVRIRDARQRWAT